MNGEIIDRILMSGWVNRIERGICTGNNSYSAAV